MQVVHSSKSMVPSPFASIEFSTPSVLNSSEIPRASPSCSAFAILKNEVNPYVGDDIDSFEILDVIKK